MKIFFAGQSPIDYDTVFKCGVKNILQSYFYIKDNMAFAHKMNKECYLFLDSGAFTAWTRKKGISIDKYIECIKEVNPPIYAGLDVIRNPEATKKNMEYMDSHGLKALPTFHHGSPLDYLYDMLDKYDYMALGGMGGGDKTQQQVMNWLDRVWRQIIRRKPEMKVHGFACSGETIMKVYPWESVDSTSWLAPVIFGRDI